MNRLKKYASLLLALVMALALAVPAMASENEGGDTATGDKTTANLTVPDLSGHEYTAYQIFIGTQAESKGALADIQWGNGIDNDGFLAALIELGYKKDDGTDVFKAEMSAAEVAEGIATFASKSEQANAIAQAAYDNTKEGTGTKINESTNLDTGYYLIVDTTTGLTGENVVYNAALLQLTDDITIETKVSVPQVDKEVQENETGKYDEAADYNIGDDVRFQFTSAVPDMSQFETYKYVFHDTMSEGLTFNAESVEVKIGDTLIVADEDTYTVKTACSDGCTFEIVFDDLKAVTTEPAGTPVVITFTAKLNENATIGGDGNSNKVKLEYSNNPNDDGDGNPPTGETPEDEVLVFTYELDTTKVNNNKVPLKDAEFYLARGEGDNTEWAIIENGKITGWTKVAAEGEDHAGTKLTTPDDGLFEIAGLDAGTYYLWETKAPAGYNTPTDPFVIVISRELIQTDGNEAYSDLKVTIDGEEGKSELQMDGIKNEEDCGAVGVDIINQSGATLPETGGIGTTIFYALGGLLTVGAVVLLVTKKRMSADEK